MSNFSYVDNEKQKLSQKRAELGRSEKFHYRLGNIPRKGFDVILSKKKKMFVAAAENLVSTGDLSQIISMLAENSQNQPVAFFSEKDKDLSSVQAF